ncbi:MAG: nitroreductase family protein [Pseudolabrys sp.]|jgi:nitroreductase
MAEAVQKIQDALAARFGERFAVDETLPGLDALARLAARRVCRRYLPRDVPAELLQLLCARALSAPSKSDLQQADIVIVRDGERRRQIAALMPSMPWLVEAPVFLVFLANGRRLPQVSALRGKPFPNDHLDLFFNATVDAAVMLATFLRAADAVGLGCCPISVIRDHARAIAELLEKVVPVSGMCVGWPADEGVLSPRLSLATTLHGERFDEGDLAAQVEAYDRRRAATRPYRGQRDVERFGAADFYGWSEDKARQYAVPQRADFGAFVRAQGFHLD